MMKRVLWRTGPLVGLIGLGLAQVLSGFLPPAYDFYGVYYPAIRAVWAGTFSYANHPGYLNPPWALVLMLPLGLVTVALARALLTVTSLGVLAYTVRYLRHRVVTLALVAGSAPLLASVWLGQIEVFSIAGGVLGWAAIQRRRWALLAMAWLLLAIKPQETWLIIGWLMLAALRRFNRREWLGMISLVAGVVTITSGWLGAGWIGNLLNGPERYSMQWQNFSLWRLTESLPTPLVIAIAAMLVGAGGLGVWRAQITRSGLALAAVLSNVLSPYLTAPHVLMTMCFGWSELIEHSRGWGIITYLTSLLPLIRLSWPDQDLNRLDVVFPVAVFVGLIVQMRAIEWLNINRRPSRTCTVKGKVENEPAGPDNL